MYELDLLDAATYRPTMTELIATLGELLATADAAQLPRPHYVAVYEALPHFSLQFEPEMSSIPAIVSWASAFCAAVRSDTCEGDDGPAIWPETNFTYENVSVTAYAKIQVPQKGPAEVIPDSGSTPGA